MPAWPSVMPAGRLDAVLIAAALWFDVFPWLSLHVPVDGSAIND